MLLVREDATFRELVDVDRVEMVHTRVLRAAPLTSGFAYTDAMHAAAALLPSPPARALCLGAGGGIVARQLAASGARVHVVDRSADVLDLAASYFELREGENLSIRCADADAFVRSTEASFDLVIIDLFGGRVASPLIASSGFFERVRQRLSPGGAVAVNLVGALDGSGGAMMLATAALTTAFPEGLALVPMIEANERARGADPACARNIVAFATNGPLPERPVPVAIASHLPALPAALAALSRRLTAFAHALDEASTGRPLRLPR
jgi:spermidine synthase